MYNEKQKKRYLNSNNRFEQTTIELLEKIFISTEMAENQFNKDVSEFNQIEVRDFLISLNSKSPRRLQSTCVFLSDYFQWCYNEGLVDNIIDPFDKRITSVIIKDIFPKELLSDKFFTKEKLIEMMEDIADVSNKFIVYALFCGIRFEELQQLKISDLDFDNNEVKLITGRTIKVDTLFKNLMIRTEDQTHYYADGIEKESKFNKYTYANSIYVLKRCGVKECDMVNTQYINNRLKVAKEQMGNKFISVSTLNKNGLINYIKEQYATQNISLKTALFDEINGKLYTYDTQTQQYIYDFGSKLTSRMIRMEVKDYIEQL